MLNLTEINNTIAELEKSDTTFTNCQRLAALYIVRDKFSATNTVEIELQDILPQYRRYCEIKRKFQLHEVTENAILNSIDGVCKEVSEFVRALYGGVPGTVFLPGQ